MTRAFLIGIFGAWLVAGCGDDGGNQAPETVIDEAPAALTRETRARFEFRSNDPDYTFECVVDDAPPQACESPFEIDVVDGAHTFLVSSRFGARIDGTPAIHEWTVDSTPPDTMITVSPPALDNATNPTFEFSAVDASAGLTFECSLDGGAFVACTSPYTVTVTTGEHTFAVRGLDPAGNIDETPATTTWTVTAGPPDTMIIAGPAEGSTTGPSVTFMFTSPDATATFECDIDAAGYGECFSPLTLSPLADGAHSFAVRAVGELETDDTPAMRAWTVDAVAPTVTITSGPTDPSNDNTPTWAFSSADATATFECSIDGAAFASCTSPFTPTTPLLDGERTFAVRGTDAVGNVGAPATSSYTLDTGGPAVTITSEPAPISNDTTPTVVFTVEASATVIECQVDAGAFAACTSPFTTTVTDGAHTIAIRASDASGNLGGDSTTFTVDTMAPTVTITTQPSSPTNDNTATIVFTTSGNPTSTTCAIDGGTPVACAGMFVTPPLAEGPHTIVVTVTDGAGNTSSAMAMFVVDTLAPTVTITSGPTGLTNDSTPTFGFSTAGSPTVIECRFDTQAFVACTSSFTPASALADGMHTFEVRVRDGAGNQNAATRDFTVDASVPTVTLTAQPLAISNDPNPRVTFTTTGSPTTTTCRLDAGTPVTCTSPHTFTAVADGSHTITVTVSDAAGNSSSATTNPFLIDTISPTVAITGGPAAGGLTNDTTPTFTFIASGATVTECRFDAQAFVSCASSFTPGVALADGLHTFEVRVSDDASNTMSATRTFTVDATPPTVTLTAQPLPNSNDPNPRVTFTTAGSPTTITCRLDAGTPVACTSPHTFTGVANGTHTITVSVSDAAGNSGSATTSSFVIDTIAPSIVITGGPVAGGLTNDNTPTFTFTVSGATVTECRFDAQPFTACTTTFTPGTALGEGARTFEIRAADAAGNTTSTTRTFTVDTVAPAVTITAQPPALSNNNDPAVSFTVTGAPTTVQCRLDATAPVTCTSGFSFTNVADGPHTITVLATDAAANTGTATTAVFTIDTVAPTVTITPKPPATGWPVNYYDFTFTTSGASIVECSMNGAAFSPCASGVATTANYATSNTFVVRVRDAAGNQGQDTATWTPTQGLVLHYQFERGSTANTSPLELVPALSPSGSGPQPFVGGWAGAALGRGLTLHGYNGTPRPLTSSPDGFYSAGFWVRSRGGNGVLLSTRGSDGGFEVRLNDGTQLQVTTIEANGTPVSAFTSIQSNRWVHIGLDTTGPSKDLAVYVNGTLAVTVDANAAYGFEPSQKELQIGPATNVDLDDVRFYNRSLGDLGICTTLARGTLDANGTCQNVLSPRFEFDFELANNPAFNTGTQSFQTGGFGFSPTTMNLGGAVTSETQEAFVNVAGVFETLPSRTLSFWFLGGHQTNNFLLRWEASCNAGACGITVVQSGPTKIDVTSTTTSGTGTVTFSVPDGRPSSVVLANGLGKLVVIVNNQEQTIDMGGGDVFQQAGDFMFLGQVGQTVDEYELWPRDLSTNAEWRCQNAVDGEWHSRNGTCLLRNN